MLTADRAAMYAALAEVFAEPPEWMSCAGREWPLFELAANFLPGSPALLGLSTLPAESRSARQARYDSLFGTGRPRFWLHESGFLNGRILGEETFAVARFYREAKLEVNGAELPDHASFEFAFLTYVAERGNLQAERRFLDEHVLRWLPALGRSLSSCGDPLYATLGQLLVDFLERVNHAEKVVSQTAIGQIPALNKSGCTLCGFCTQRCPTRALFISETESQTSLMLFANQCDSCGQCLSACQDGLLSLTAAADGSEKRSAVLFVSDRVACRICGAPTVSAAELNYMIQKIGRSDWLDLCLTCRVSTPHGGVR